MEKLVAGEKRGLNLGDDFAFFFTASTDLQSFGRTERATGKRENVKRFHTKTTTALTRS